ncbi:phosphate/phosphite/phosphonate ABC transporter substrate-binding protein [Caenimonas soli]|uniref:phosphate/phosphite/phosphonate ABC transporter substrate-binding protein n=1 Tax=Caenimonas soli TaxID=2735555 RepID=UPI001554AE4D|nr:PhnD/SsuA/transferrin family substrate-binding protein [Caenimonas soli]NPC54225.1 PhnD/SsuA/transferrin family substrate-binding protein [Caenimonas soli]
MNLPNSESRLNRRTLLVRGAAAAAVCAVPVGWAQQSGDRWRLLVNEAVTADLSISMLAMRYRGWAEYMGSQIQNKQVLVDPIIDIPRFVQQAQSEQKPLLVFGKSVNQLSKLVRDHGYQPLVRRPEPYKAAFIVPKDSPIQNFTQLGGRKLLLPDTYSATAAMARAEIRRQDIREPYMSHTRFQDSVAGQVAAGMAEAGVVNPTIARKWQEAGGRIIGETQPVVNWSVLASPKASPEMVARLTNSLLAMNGQASGGLLSDIGVKQWAKAERKEYLALLEYTGE